MSEVRLIDANALKANLPEPTTDRQNWVYRTLCDFIDNAPTVEEVSVIEFKEPLPPVKAHKIIRALDKRPQGKWILTDGKSFECPFCHRLFDFSDNYCGYCGARMKDGSNEQLRN